MVLCYYKKQVLQKNPKINWKEECNCNLFFSHGKSNSCVVLIGFPGNKIFTPKKLLCNENGRIFILETLIDGTVFILFNFYNANA